MSYFGYSPAPSSAYNNSSSQLLGSPTSSSGGGMSGSTSPSGITTNSSSNNASSSSPPPHITSSASSCCEGGRPLVTDPVTGQSVCSCQYDPTRLTLSSYPRLAAAYSTSPYVPPSEQNPYPTLESSAFYSPLGGAYAAAGLKEGSGTGDVSCWPNPGSLQSGYYPYDPTFAAAAYGYGGGYDLAARRKNATRESTATLKAWLNEHKKNPYPTKGEKIMLAIITKMTLTQVSTWFANARRRLKKENKMTWEPKNKTDDDDEDLKDDDDDCDSSSHGAPSPPPHHHHHHHNNNNNTIGLGKPDPSSDHHHLLKSDCSGNGTGGNSTNNKPKIWSLADTAACKTPPPPTSHFLHQQGGGGTGGTLNYHHPHLNVLSHHPGAAAASMAAHQFQQHAANAMALAPHHHHHPTPVTSSWSFALPPYTRSPYGGFLGVSGPTTSSSNGPSSGGNGDPSSGSMGIGGTETPPQTPPNLKVPLLPGSLVSHYHHQPNHSSNPMASSAHHHPHLHPIHHHHPHQGLPPSSVDLNSMGTSGGTSTAFKPVLKSVSGGFCV